MARHMAERPEELPQQVDVPRHDASSDGSDKPARKNVLSNLLIAVGVILLLVAGGIYAYNAWNYHKIDEGNERIAEYAKLSDDQNEPPEVDWDALKAINPDVVGWLQIPGTIVNYPVFQTTNNDYYLNHTAERESSIGGAVFMDFENKAPGMVDQQTIIYGHHMRNGSQFKPIADMDNQELFDDVSTIWYATERGPYELTPLFLYYTTADDVDVRQFEFADDEAFHAYLNRYFAQAVAKRPDAAEAIASAKHVLTLSTCNYYDGAGRTLLVCIPKSELPSAQTAE